MDEELEEFFDNGTLYEDYYYGNTEVKNFINISSLFILIGLICDLIIIYLIARTKLMKSKTNYILLNWAIWDFICLLATRNIFGLLLDLLGVDYLNIFSCGYFRIETWSQFLTLTLIIIIISNKIMENKGITLKHILTTIYSTFVALLILKIVLCSQNQKFPFMEYGLLIVYYIVVMVIIAKEIIFRCRKNNSEEVSFETKFRFNIGRIYVYSWVISFIYSILSPFFHKPLPVLRYLLELGFLNPLFILIYIVYSDITFKISFLSLIKCNFRDNSVDATIRFAQEARGDAIVNIDIDNDENKA